MFIIKKYMFYYIFHIHIFKDFILFIILIYKINYNNYIN